MKNKIINICGIMMVGALIIGTLTGCGESANAGNTKETIVESEMQESKMDTEAEITAETKEEAGKGEFASFGGKDFEGNSVDQSMLAKNKITVLNFWFNGCSACVSEMPDLEKFSETLKEKGAELVGVNVEAVYSDDKLKEAKEILEKEGATYKNIMITDGDTVLTYMNNIMAFPTTILVDQNGNIIGDSYCGTINSEEIMNEILETIENYKGEGENDK